MHTGAAGQPQRSLGAGNDLRQDRAATRVTELRCSAGRLVIRGGPQSRIKSTRSEEGQMQSTNGGAVVIGASMAGRSEEHTSELQSLTNLVCRLLLEKKKR